MFKIIHRTTKQRQTLIVHSTINNSLIEDILALKRYVELLRALAHHYDDVSVRFSGAELGRRAVDGPAAPAHSQPAVGGRVDEGLGRRLQRAAGDRSDGAGGLAAGRAGDTETGTVLKAAAGGTAAETMGRAAS